MSNPTAAMLVIGDEILSGRTQDSNTHHLAVALSGAGIDLCEARVIRDDGDAIAAAVQVLSAEYDHVFTSGGIGPTHDDITADSVARAMNRSIGIRADARAILAEHYKKSGVEMNEARLRMARIPDSATLIDNPVSAAPGFTVENVHVLAGVPSIFKAMVASILPTLNGGAPLMSVALDVYRGEGDVAAPLAELASRYPQLTFGSYPFQRKGVHGTNLLARGQDVAALDAALAEMTELFG